MERLGSREHRRIIWMENAAAQLFLLGMTLVLMFLPVGQGSLFGSEGDWYSQHVAAAETLRQVMRANGTIFPQTVGIGGGVNAYALAYYGLLRPDVLLSCLLPDVPMRDIISGYAAAGEAASVILVFHWLKGKNLSTWFSIYGGLLTAAAACFFHAHHQIMFVSYMPFLILALIGIDRLIENGKSLQLTVSVFLICIHSFFYAPACLMVCLLYGIDCLQRREALREKDGQAGYKKTVLQASAAAAAGIGAAAVLLLPTALEILSTEKDGGRFAQQTLAAVDFSFSSLLYQPYGCGMTLLVLYCLLLSLTGKRNRKIAGILLVILSVPVISLVLSGFLYARGKMLIPLLPLLVWICADTMEELSRGSQKPQIFPAVLCLIPILFSEKIAWKPFMLLDFAVVLGCVLMMTAGYRRTRIGCSAAAQKMVRTASLLLIVVPLCTGPGVSIVCENWLASDDQRQSRFTPGEITMFAEDTRYRFDFLANSYVNSNVLPDAGLSKTACYLSVTGDLYADFYYNVMRNSISLRNRVVLMPGANSLFNYFMGIRYVLAEENHLPFGYRPVFRRNGFVLAENPDVLPICYGTEKVMTGGTDLTAFPETAGALCGVQVHEEAIEDLFETRFPDSFNRTQDGCYTLTLRNSLRDCILMLSFDVERRDGREISITVGGMKNLLSGKSAPYPNHNETFTYVLAKQPMKTLQIEFSPGDYELKNVRAFIAEMPSVRNADISIPVYDPGFRRSDRKLFLGEIVMRGDGYFATSYPFRKGYQIFVDGKPKEAELMNGAFLGFPLRAGKHRVEIYYEAPGFQAGAWISLLSAAAVVIVAAVQRKRERKRR